MGTRYNMKGAGKTWHCLCCWCAAVDDDSNERR